MTTQQTFKKKLEEVKSNLLMMQSDAAEIRGASKYQKSIQIEELVNYISEIVNKIETTEEVTISYLEMLIHDLFKLNNLISAKIIRDNKEAYIQLIHYTCSIIRKVTLLRRIMYNEIEEQKYI